MDQMNWFEGLDSESTEVLSGLVNWMGRQPTASRYLQAFGTVMRTWRRAMSGSSVSEQALVEAGGTALWLCDEAAHAGLVDATVVLGQLMWSLEGFLIGR